MRKTTVLWPYISMIDVSLSSNGYLLNPAGPTPQQPRQWDLFLPCLPRLLLPLASSPCSLLSSRRDFRIWFGESICAALRWQANSEPEDGIPFTGAEVGPSRRLHYLWLQFLCLSPASLTVLYKQLHYSSAPSSPHLAIPRESYLRWLNLPVQPQTWLLMPLDILAYLHRTWQFVSPCR